MNPEEEAKELLLIIDLINKHIESLKSDKTYFVLIDERTESRVITVKNNEENKQLLKDVLITLYGEKRKKLKKEYDTLVDKE